MSDWISYKQYKALHGKDKPAADVRKAWNKYVAKKKAATTDAPTPSATQIDTVEPAVDRFLDEPIAEHLTVIHNVVKKELTIPDFNEPAPIGDRDPKAIRQIGQDGHLLMIKPLWIAKSARGLVGTSGANIEQKLERS